MGRSASVFRGLGTTVRPVPRARLPALCLTPGFRFTALDILARHYELIVPITTTLSHAPCFLGLVEEVCRIPSVAKLRSVARLLPYIKRLSRILTFAEAAEIVMSVVVGKKLLNPTSVNIARRVASEATITDGLLGRSTAGNVTSYHSSALPLTVATEDKLSCRQLISTSQESNHFGPLGRRHINHTRLHKVGASFPAWSPRSHQSLNSTPSWLWRFRYARAFTGTI